MYASLSRWMEEYSLWGLLICLVVTTVVLGGYAVSYQQELDHPGYYSPLSRLEFPFIDLRFEALARPGEAREDVVVVAITEQSINMFQDDLGRWPWPRRVFAALYRHLRESSGVLVDIGFWEPSKAELTASQVRRMKNLLLELRRRIGSNNPSSARQPYSKLLNRMKSLSASDDRTLAAYSERFGPVHYSMTFTEEPLPEGKETLERYRRFFGRYRYEVKNYGRAKRMPRATLPIDPLLQSSAAVGHINFEPDPDGPARRFSPFVRVESNRKRDFSPDRPFVAMLGVSGGLHARGIEPGDGSVRVEGRNLRLGDTLSIPLDRRGKVLFNFRGPNPYRVVPIEQLLARIYGFKDEGGNPIQSPFTPDWFEGKHVLIGATAPGLFDLRANPFNASVPGVLFHAAALDMLLSRDFMVPIRLRDTLLGILGVSVAVGVATTYLAPITAAAVSLAVVLLYGGWGFYLFRQDYLLNLSGPLLAGGANYLMILLYNLIFEQRKKRQIKNAFQHYLTNSVMEEVLKDPDELELGGERREISVMFADVAGFTTFSEGRTAIEVASAISDILTELTECVFRYEGVLDKYIGDALVAEFGIIPVESPDHARRACFAALDMRARMEQLGEVWDQEDRPRMEVRIGVHTGMAATGNMGSEMLFDYTAIGDTVNLSARLESANKQYGTLSMISESTYRKVREYVEVRELDRIVVKGKKKPVSVYELLSRVGALSPEQRDLRDRFEEALSLYRNKRWDRAIEAFDALVEDFPGDEPSRIFRERARQYKQNPPDVDWQGVWKLESK